MEGANSTEFEPEAEFPVVALITEWMEPDGLQQTRVKGNDLGGTMRLGSQPCNLAKNTLSRSLYGHDVIHERHRHRYEVNGRYAEQLEKGGLKIAGRSGDQSLVEIIEIEDHPWFVASQFHPEFTSTPREGHALFSGFIRAAIVHKDPADTDAEQAKTGADQ